MSHTGTNLSCSAVTLEQSKDKSRRGFLKESWCWTEGVALSTGYGSSIRRPIRQKSEEKGNGKKHENTYGTNIAR